MIASTHDEDAIFFLWEKVGCTYIRWGVYEGKEGVVWGVVWLLNLSRDEHAAEVVLGPDISQLRRLAVPLKTQCVVLSDLDPLGVHGPQGRHGRRISRTGGLFFVFGMRDGGGRLVREM